MFRLPHLVTALALMGALTANAEGRDLTVHKLPDDGHKDFGENKGPKPIKCTIMNAGPCPITVIWFDITVPGGKWRKKTLKRFQKWHHTLLVGEHLMVKDVADHRAARFGLLRR